MNKLIFLILTILIISIKSQWENEKIRITCNKNSRGLYHCVYFTRHSSCYVSSYSSFKSYVRRCEVNEINETKKRSLEYLIEKERWMYENEDEEDE